MHKCVHSTKALDVFVKEVAGLHLRHQRAQLYFQKCRPFGTTRTLRQTETSKLAAVDDGFIPFELTRKLKRSSASQVVQSPEQDPEPQEVEATPENASVETDDAEVDWHAAIEVDAHVIATAGNQGEVVEDTSTPEWVKPATLKPLSRKQRVVQKSTSAADTTSTARLARKERRQAEGKLGVRKAKKTIRTAEAEVKQTEQALERLADGDEETDQVQTVLAKLDQDLGGPSIIKAQQKSAERLAAKSIEKKRQAQLTAAKKHDDKRKAVAEAEAQRTRKMEPWQRDKAALQQKFGEEGWAPRKRLSPDSLEGIRALHSSDPATYTTAMLSQHFQITPEAIRRILKSKWKPKPEEIEQRMQRWESRGVKKWQEMSELGMKPPKKWRIMGVPNPKTENRKKWEDATAEKPINAKTGKKERWKNLDKHQKSAEALAEVSLAGRL